MLMTGNSALKPFYLITAVCAAVCVCVKTPYSHARNTKLLVVAYHAIFDPAKMQETYRWLIYLNFYLFFFFKLEVFFHCF